MAKLPYANLLSTVRTNALRGEHFSDPAIPEASAPPLHLPKIEPLPAAISQLYERDSPGSATASTDAGHNETYAGRTRKGIPQISQHSPRDTTFTKE